MFLLDFLKQLAESNAYFRFILERGRYFKGYRCDQRLIKRVKPKLKQCFDNAIKLCLLSKGRYRYFEGFMLSPDLPIPIEHAWNLDEKGRVVDLTACLLKLPKETEYFGVEVPYSFLKERVREIRRSVKTPLKIYWLSLHDI